MNITGIKKLAKDGKSPYFFSTNTMKFFNSKVFPDVKRVRQPEGFLFITSEKFAESPRHYQVRHITPDGFISYYGQRLETLEDAKSLLNRSFCTLLVGYDPTFKRREHLKTKQMLNNIGEDRV
tara:strand:+ start:308 stop:676 length:369 start_codon:yes stop_codon:yes gene_type:complete